MVHAQEETVCTAEIRAVGVCRADSLEDLIQARRVKSLGLKFPALLQAAELLHNCPNPQRQHSPLVLSQ